MIGALLVSICNICRVTPGLGRDLQEAVPEFRDQLVEGHVMADHVHMCLGIPPKYSVANTVGKLKGKSAIMIHQKHGRVRNFVG
jgi:putative transposase